MHRAVLIKAIAGSILLLGLVLTIACIPQLSPSQAPPTPAIAPLQPAPNHQPSPNIEATVEALVAKYVREEMAAIPTVTPAPTATPMSLPASQLAAATSGMSANQADTPAHPAAPSDQLTAPANSASANLPGSIYLSAMVNRVKPGVVRINTSSGVGSGIIADTAAGQKGLVLTNYHVVSDSFRIDVLVNDNRTFRGRVVGFDEERDLAVLEICCDDFQKLEFSSAANISAGSEVVAIGYALGLTGNATVTRGIVSAIRYHPTMKAWVIQTDASINPGNSGGPLLLPTGEVIGVTTFLQSQDNRGNPTAGLGFAISEQSIREMLPDLMGGAKVVRSPQTGNGGSGPGSRAVDWQTYTNVTHNYSIDVPAGWSVDDSDDSHIHFDSPDDFAGSTVISYDEPVDTLESWLDDVLEQHRNFYRGRFQLVERETSGNSQGKSGAYIVFRAQVSRQFCLLRVTELFFQFASGNFVASFHICEHSYSQYAPIQQAVLSSFELP